MPCGMTQAKLGQQAPDLVGLRGAGLDKTLACPVQGQNSLLPDILNRYESHVGPDHRFANRLGVRCVVLVGFHELRRHQSHGVAHALQFTRPVMRAAAGFHSDQARWQLDKELGHLQAAQLLLEHCFARLVDAVDLKDLFREVNADDGGLHGERSYSGLK